MVSKAKGCKGWNYHVWSLGSARCTMCGALRSECEAQEFGGQRGMSTPNAEYVLPQGARWAECQTKGPIPPRHPWMMRARTPWWRLYGQTTVYAGQHYTPVVYCDSEAIADAVMAAHNGGPDA